MTVPTTPNDAPKPASDDPERLIDAVAEVMRPGGWLSGPCPTPTEQVPEMSEDES